MAALISPLLYYDLDRKIISYLDNDNLVVLSGINRRTYGVLSNDSFFKELFEKQHPFLVGLNNVFKNLRLCHPHNCWKVACCILRKEIFSVSSSFLKESIPLISQCLKLQKAHLEVALKEICGHFYADPLSSID